MNVIEPTPHLSEPDVFYSLQLQAEAGSGGYNWEVDTGSPLPDGLTLSPSGLISGTPSAFFNSQVVVVKVTDAVGAFRKEHLTLFTPPNPVPVAGSDSAVASSGHPVSIDVLANDFDADAQPSALSIVSVASPSWGRAEIVGDEIVYTPDGNLSSRDSFTYTITDGEHLTTGSIEVVHNSGYVWIPLDDASGDSVSDAHGTRIGSLFNFGDAEAAFVQGKYGNAVTFDGTNDQVTLNTLQDLPLGSSPRTLMCWIRTPVEVPTEAQGIFGYGNKSGSQRILLQLLNEADSPVQRLSLDIWGATLLGSTNLADNQWHHVAVVCGDFNENGSLTIGECKLYVDGVLEAAEMTDPSRANRALNTVAGPSPVIGGANVTAKSHFRGEIDDVRIFPVALSADEVAAYAAGRADAASRWHLEHFGNASAIWTADDDSDQLNRLAEYALGGDPLSADASDFGYELRFDPDTLKLEASFNRRQAGTHQLNYQVQSSSDLVDWESLTTRQVSVQPHPALSGFDRVTFETNNDATSISQLFLRLRIVEQ